MQEGCVGDCRRRGRALSFRAALRVLAPITLGPEGNYSTGSAWSLATPACASPRIPGTGPYGVTASPRMRRMCSLYVTSLGPRSSIRTTTLAACELVAPKRQCHWAGESEAGRAYLTQPIQRGIPNDSSVARISTPAARRSLSYQRRFSSGLGRIALLASQIAQEIQTAMRPNPTTYWRGE